MDVVDPISALVTLVAFSTTIFVRAALSVPETMASIVSIDEMSSELNDQMDCIGAARFSSSVSANNYIITSGHRIKK